MDDAGYDYGNGGSQAGAGLTSGGSLSRGGSGGGGNGQGGVRATGGRASASSGDGGGRNAGAETSPSGGLAEMGAAGSPEAAAGMDAGDDRKPTGADCTENEECGSGSCRDGVCCESQCNAECQACAEEHTGFPDGTCADALDGAGACAVGSAVDCGEFPCNAEGCETPCSDAEDCPSLSYCAGSVCRTCATGHKVCENACIPADDCCGGCSGDRPVCEKAVCVARKRGDACTSSAERGSGHCMDGFCCDSACTGQCQSCSATPGTCKAVSTPRTPCSGSGTCAGKCDGVNGMSCVYPSTQTACAAASCSGGSLTPAASCNGSGSCATPTSMTCAFGCESGGKACSQCRQKSSSNLLQNPGFDGNASSWTFAGGAAYQPNRDSENCSASGSVLIETISQEVMQCRPASPDTFYSFGFRFRGTGPGSEPSSFCAMIFYKGSGCSTASATSNIVTVTALGNLTTWVQGTGTAQSPPDAGSVWIACAGQGGFGYYDQFFLSSTNATF